MNSSPRPESPNTVEHRLIFEDLSIEITLRGFSWEFVAMLAGSWLCRVEEGAGQGEPFLFELIPKPELSYTAQALQEAIREGNPHHRQIGKEDHLLLPGARVRVRPDRPVARIEVHPDLLSNLELLHLAVRTALPRALAYLSATCIHAAAFEMEGIPILAVGPSGAGKSTLAAAAIAAGGRVVSDDSLILSRRTDGAIIVRPSRSHLLFRDPTPELFDEDLRSRLSRWKTAGVERWRLSRETLPSIFAPSLEPRVILFLRRARNLHHHQIERQIHSLALSELLAANISSYQLGTGYEAQLQHLTGLLGALLSECSILRLKLAEVSNLQDDLDARELVRLLGSDSA